MKIIYIYSSLAYKGGTERMLTEKINYMTEHYGYDITIINCYQSVDTANTFLLSKGVKQINLGIPFFSQYKYRYPKRLWVRRKISRQTRKEIYKAVQEINPDILIGTCRVLGNLISTTKCNAMKIIECHEVKFTALDIGVQRSAISRFFQNIYEFFYFRTIEQNADIIVTLTDQDKQLWKRAKQVEVIPNFSTMKIRQYSDCTPKRVIAVGRLEWEKGFGRLIEAWSIASSRYPDWHLDIYGEGNMYNTLIKLIKIYKTKNITIHNFVTDISKEYISSSICAVSSYFEGFSLVVLEALKHGVPCVAFDCPFGPRSIISDASCGFLVDNGDIRLFAERLSLLMGDENLRKQFSETAIRKANTFDVDIIMNKWKYLFESCLK